MRTFQIVRHRSHHHPAHALKPAHGDERVEDRCFRLPSLEAIFSSTGWLIAVLVVVAERESNVGALQLNRN